jgi:predicted transcriptional regulator
MRYPAVAKHDRGPLRELRESAGITQRRLAALAYVGIATVRKIETGAVIQAGYVTVLARWPPWLPRLASSRR